MLSLTLLPESHAAVDPARVPGLPVLRSGMLAHWDSFAGLVRVRVLSVTGRAGIASTAQEVIARVTQNRGPYKRGECVTGSGHAFIPPKCVRRRKFSTVLLPFQVQPDPQE